MRSKFSQIVADEFYKMDMTFEEFQKRYKVNRSTMNAIVNDLHTDPRLRTLLRLSKAFKCSIDYLVGIDESNR